MRRIIAVTLTVLFTLVLAIQAQEHFALEDLHLLSWENVPDAGPNHLAPLSAAILMAWTAEHGYPELLPDLNGDGLLDEADTALLARAFGEPMRAHEPLGVADPWLVEVLAQYIAERYPDAFRMLIYDDSFPEEVLEHLGHLFDPNSIPGIELAVYDDPTHEVYTLHVEEGRPGVVGFGFEPERNRFSVSRSFGFEEAPEGWPVDLVNTDLGAFGPEPVWNTFLRWEPDRWGFLTPEWIPFEILIVLVPLHEQSHIPGTPDQPGEPGDHPGDTPGDTPGTPGKPGDDPGDPFDPGATPGGDPGDVPGGSSSGTPGDYPGGEPGDPFDPETGWPCCLPDGSCRNLSVEECQRLDGISNLSGAPCERLECSRSSYDPTCGAIEGRITDICYTYERGILKVTASYEITNTSPVAAEDVTVYALVGLGDGVQGLGGGPECQDWQYGVDIPGNGTYTFTREFSKSVPTLDLDNLSYLYGSLWLQMEAPWDCWPIVEQAFVRTWDPAPLCQPLQGEDDGTPPGGSDIGEPGDSTGRTPDLDGTGACCLPDGSCDQLDESECVRRDGLFYGPGVDCSEIRCFPASDDPCPIIYSEVTEMCQTYRGPNEPMIVKATFVLRNPGSEDAVSVKVRLMAGGPLEPNLVLPYKDEYILTIPVIPAGGSQTLTQTFTISPAPPQEPATTAALVFAVPITPLCKPKIQSAVQLFNLEVLQRGERPCPSTDGGGDEDGACCLPDGSCESLDSVACTRRDGTFQGAGTSCARITCDPNEPEPEPNPVARPNLWVTDMTGCWTWSNDGQEHVIATVTGVVHNGGQATASNVRAKVTAGGKSTTVTVGTLEPGSVKTVSATIDVGAYDLVSWPVPTSITADPFDSIDEADETNNTTNSSFPQSSDCN